MVNSKTNFISDKIGQIFSGSYLAFIGFAFILFSSGCNHYYYAPSSNFTPLFTEKDELSFNLHDSLGWEHAGGEFQGAWAFGKHTAVMASIFSATAEEGTVETSNTTEGNESKDWGDGTYYEGAFGYFTALTKGESYRKGVFEIYGGVGKGNVTNSFGLYRTIENSFTKVFVQPSLGYKSKVFDLAFSGKLSFVDIGFKGSSRGYPSLESDLNDLQFVQAHPKSLMWEPGLVAELGWLPIKVKMQLTRSINLTYSEYPQDNFIFAIGVNARFNVTKQRLVGGK
ncbi:hypothetical protein [Desertivirga arenae]|uniref:hypothetical protein n=1 Tax=Desertivirga arenae TaxID=2810309 RepID=UPI001A97C99A|nr:hypothetical protein [Pedobacter sp. SYSU D00823]